MKGILKGQGEQHIRKNGKCFSLKSDVLFIVLMQSFGIQYIKITYAGSEVRNITEQKRQYRKKKNSYKSFDSRRIQSAIIKRKRCARGK